MYIPGLVRWLSKRGCNRPSGTIVSSRDVPSALGMKTGFSLINSAEVRAVRRTVRQRGCRYEASPKWSRQHVYWPLVCVTYQRDW